MTEDEKYEVATLATDLQQKIRTFECHQIVGQPHDTVERESAMAAYFIAQTEMLEAYAALARAQQRIVGSK